MELTIRKAREHDYPQVHSLIKEFSLFQGAPEKVTVTPERMAEDKDLFQCFVAEADNKEIVGFASFFFAYYSWTGKALYLDDLYVREAFRKQGTGKKLLQAVIDLAEREGCKKVRWQVSKWNTNAIDFYKCMGAAIDEVEINCDLMINAQ
jgi:GNAT superfamily N-acetyltransferase